jgi:sporulation protein YlmC with PRC-barrel domain
MPDVPNESRRSLAGMKVYSSEGQSVGTIADVYFEEDDGRIVGFEVTGGVVDDLASGRRFLPADELDHIGDDIVYVRPESAESLGPVPGGSTGASGAVADAKDKVGQAMQSAGDKIAEAGGAVDKAMQSEGPDAAPRQDREPRQEARPGADLVGRRAGAEVAGADGRIIVANGQVISDQHVARAEAAGRIDQLRAAADAWSAAERERMISGAVEQVTDAAGSAWDRLMGKISELTDESGKRLSEQQTKARLAAINDAVGRPVTKVILDRDDDVILNLGDIITHESVQRAYDAGILDTLLDSVYRGDVAFERDEMRAPTEGTSTVEKASGSAAVVQELEETVEAAEAERTEAGEARRREAEEGREQRENERQERAQAREEAARRAAAGEPHEGPAEDDQAAAEGDVDGPGQAQEAKPTHGVG